MASQYLTDAQVIELLQLNHDDDMAKAKERLRNRRRLRQIPYVKIGRLIRYRESDIEELLKKQTVHSADV